MPTRHAAAPVEVKVSRAPLISVVTPFFDVAGYLGDAIESVVAQSFRNWELLLVDDGSSDAGPEIARRYAERYPDRIVVLQHPDGGNHGSSASRNLAARHARGRWIAYLDSDDVWLPHKLDTQLAILNDHPEVGLVMGASLYWNSWAGEGSGPDRVVPVGAPPDRVYHPPELLRLLYPLAGGAAPCPSSILVDADLLRRVGGWEEGFRTPYDDQYVLAKLYLATPAYVSAACLDRYRQRPGSFMDTGLRGRDYHLHRRRFLEWFEARLEQELGDPDIRRRVRAALRRYRHPFLSRLMRAGSRMARRLLRPGG